VTLRHHKLGSFLKRLVLDELFAAAEPPKPTLELKKIGEYQQFLPLALLWTRFLALSTSRNTDCVLVNKAKLPSDFVEYADILQTTSKNNKVWELSCKIKQIFGEILLIPSPLPGETKIVAFLQSIPYDRTRSELVLHG